MKSLFFFPNIALFNLEYSLYSSTNTQQHGGNVVISLPGVSNYRVGPVMEVHMLMTRSHCESIFFPSSSKVPPGTDYGYLFFSSFFHGRLAKDISSRSETRDAPFKRSPPFLEPRSSSSRGHQSNQSSSWRSEQSSPSSSCSSSDPP